MKVGSFIEDNICKFIVWAPKLDKIILSLENGGINEEYEMKKDNFGYWTKEISNIKEGQRYYYKIAGEKYPDPASKSQPEGVHKASEVVKLDKLKTKYAGIELSKMIIYEIHVGTFTEKGNFQGIIENIKYLKELGINTVELMPLAQFPGKVNWGYDGVYPFAVQNTYGGLKELQNLIDELHKNNIAIIIDVVYNHLGPEGNYLSKFAPYFNPKYNTPWGSALNFDSEYSYGVRDYFIQNALFWIKELGADGLRLDAVHEIYDKSSVHILSEISENIKKIEKEENRKIVLIAESDLNDTKIINPKMKGGYEIDAQWCDDFHHSIHTFLTSEFKGYYEDFGKFEYIEKTYKEGFVYSGQYSEHRKKYLGKSSKDISPEKIVVCIQNHDQIGNRLFGERLSKLIEFEKLKLAAGALFLSPYTPMIFMGEEYAEKNPFMFFSDYGDENLKEGVKLGRKKEFEYFGWKDEFIDPQSKETYEKSILNKKIEKEENKIIFEIYKLLIKLKKDGYIGKRNRKNIKIKTFENKKIVYIESLNKDKKTFSILNFSNEEISIGKIIPDGKWEKIIDSSSEKWLGKGSNLPKILTGKLTIKVNSHSFIIYKEMKKSLF